MERQHSCVQCLHLLLSLNLRFAWPGLIHQGLNFAADIAMHIGCSSSLQVSFTWPISTRLPHSCVHGAVTLGCLSVCPSSRSHSWMSPTSFVVSSCARLDASTALPELSPIPSLPRRSCSATHCGMNGSVCTECLGVAFGVTVLGHRSDRRPYLCLVIMQRTAARACGSQLCFAVCVRDVANMSSKETLRFAVFPPSTVPSTVLQAPHVAEHNVSTVVCLDDPETPTLDPAQHPGRSGW